MYSFYGGQKGQDFRISKIFENRSEDLLKDLQARWYSSINVGDYVFINYGNIADSDKINITPEGKIEEIPSNYNRNLNIDLLNCGKSYTNSIWQKVYIDDSKEISPQFPDSENNVFVFINFEENEVLQDSNNNYYIQINDGNVLRKQPTDKNGNWIDQNGNIIRLTQQPGHSLREVVDIYSEEYYGFGYRLIACVTGSTPRLQVYHQTINIEDGEPYVTCDLTNPDKPAIKFYQQRAQRIEKVFNQTIAPTKSPEVRMLTNGEMCLDTIASLTEPILEMNLPRAIQYYTGQLFGKDRNISNFTSYTKENTFSDFNPETTVAMMHREEVLRAKAAAEFFYDLLTQNKEVDKENSNKRIFSINSEKIETILFDKEKKYIYEYLYNYYYPDGLLYENNKNVPYGQYGFREDNINNIKEILGHIEECTTGEDVIDKVAEAENIQEFVGLLEEASFMSFGIYEQLSSESQTNYLNRFKSGFAAGSLTILINLLPPSNLNITDFLLNINKNSYDASYVYMVLQFLSMIKNNFDTHFDSVVNKALPGDIYLNNAVGKIYQIINIDNSTDDKKSISAIYLGKMTSPPPFAIAKEVSSYVEDSQGKFKSNEITIENNLMSYGEDLSLNEQYIFSIPKTPEFICEIKRNNEIKVESEIANPNTKKFTFNFPFGAHIFTNRSGLTVTFNENNDFITITSNDNNNEYNLNDIFIYLEDDSKYNGNVYTYIQLADGQYVWEKTGSIRGPIGTVPQPKAELCFINNDTEDGVSEEVSNNGFSYIYKKAPAISVEKALKTIIDNSLSSLSIQPKDFFYVHIFDSISDNTRSLTGEQSETIEITDAQLKQTWWTYYQGDNIWATSLMTGNVAIATGKTGDIDSQSYSVKYINHLIGDIDSNTTVANEIKNINNKIGTINSDTVADKITNINNRIDNINSEITSMNNKIGDIDSDITIAGEITNINNNATNIKKEIQDIKGLITWKILGEGS